MSPIPEAGLPLRLLAIEHEADAPVGLLGGWAAGRGMQITTVAMHAGQPLPTRPQDFAGVVVLGSERTAYDDSVPWLADELTLVERSLAADVPVLGICFGGQVLARVLGARLYRLPAPEIGWVQVRSSHSLLAPGPWPSWHQDAFELPAAGVELAVNPVSVQAFAVGPHAGLQFHPEATQPILADWLAAARTPPGPEITDPLFGADSGAAWKRAAQNAAILFSAWFDGELTPR